MRTATESRSVWPWAIAAGLLLVVLVNAAMAYIAIQGSDPIVSSYRTETR